MLNIDSSLYSVVNILSNIIDCLEKELKFNYLPLHRPKGTVAVPLIYCFFLSLECHTNILEKKHLVFLETQRRNLNILPSCFSYVSGSKYPTGTGSALFIFLQCVYVPLC